MRQGLQNAVGDVAYGAGKDDVPLNSVNTNIAAQLALQSLDTTTTQLQASQKRISTGYRVADATDDGASFAVAQRVRGDVGALTTANQQLGNAKGIVGVALTALTSISNDIASAQSLLIDIADTSVPQAQRDQYVESYKSLVTVVADTTDASTYNGLTLLGSAAGPVTGASVSVINNEVGATTTISPQDTSTLANTLATFIGSTFSRTTAGIDSFAAIAPGADQASAEAALMGSTGSTTFDTTEAGLTDQLNQAGADSNRLNATISFNSDKIDSLNTGLGSLIDTDLSKEAATLQALQVREQLGTQALSLANQSPQSLLSLFK